MKHSSYFNGKVQSLSMNSPEGSATVGVMEPGSYQFSTTQQETMVVTEGTLLYRFPGEDWKTVNKGERFVVAPGSAFDCEAKNDVSYICYYR